MQSWGSEKGLSLLSTSIRSLREPIRAALSRSQDGRKLETSPIEISLWWIMYVLPGYSIAVTNKCWYRLVCCPTSRYPINIYDSTDRWCDLLNDVACTSCLAFWCSNKVGEASVISVVLHISCCGLHYFCFPLWWWWKEEFRNNNNLISRFPLFPPFERNNEFVLE